MHKPRGLSLLAIAIALLASFATASTATAAVPAAKRVVPIWAGISHGKPVPHGIVVVRSRDGRPLAPRARTGRTGLASVIAPRVLPRRFVVEVRRQRKAGRALPVLRADVRNWKRPRVVYVNPFSTVVSEYGKLHPGMSAAMVTMRVQRHLGVGPESRTPDASTFWSGRAFSGKRFARAAHKHDGIVVFSRRIAREVDRSRRPHRFPARGAKKKGKGGGKGAGASSVATASAKPALEKLAERERLENELIDAAKTVASVATGSPSALVELGQLLDSLLGGGDTAELKQISSQLASIQIGISNIEQQVSAVDAEVSLAAYSAAVDSYRSTQQAIDAAWETYLHLIAAAAEGKSGAAEAEAKALAAELKDWTNIIASTAAVPADEGSPGLMAWAQNALAKGQAGGVMTAANQQVSQAAGFKWWSYWWKDMVLHAEKWDDPATNGEIGEGAVKQRTNEALKGLERAKEDEYGKTLPESVVYAISAGKLYSVGTVWNVAPSVAPPASGQPAWSLMTQAEAEALPSAAVGLRQAMLASIPEEWEQNPNKSMSGVLGEHVNDGTWPEYKGTAGGYGTPPTNTQLLALGPNGGGECYGQWNWLANGDGSSNTTGAPIIRLCPALNAATDQIVPTVCSQISNPGTFYGWSADFPSREWSPGIWHNWKPVPFETCTDFEFWQGAGSVYAGLNWGDGFFVGSSPLSTALNISNSDPAYYGLWTRPVGPSDDFLVGPVTNSG